MRHSESMLNDSEPEPEASKSGRYEAQARHVLVSFTPAPDQDPELLMIQLVRDRVIHVCPQPHRRGFMAMTFMAWGLDSNSEQHAGQQARAVVRVWAQATSRHRLQAWARMFPGGVVQPLEAHLWMDSVTRRRNSDKSPELFCSPATVRMPKKKWGLACGTPVLDIAKHLTDLETSLDTSPLALLAKLALLDADLSLSKSELSISDCEEEDEDDEEEDEDEGWDTLFDSDAEEEDQDSDEGCLTDKRRASVCQKGDTPAMAPQSRPTRKKNRRRIVDSEEEEEDSEEGCLTRPTTRTRKRLKIPDSEEEDEDDGCLADMQRAGAGGSAGAPSTIVSTLKSPYTWTPNMSFLMLKIADEVCANEKVPPSLNPNLFPQYLDAIFETMKPRISNLGRWNGSRSPTNAEICLQLDHLKQNYGASASEFKTAMMDIELQLPC